MIDRLCARKKWKSTMRIYFMWMIRIMIKNPCTHFVQKLQASTSLYGQLVLVKDVQNSHLKSIQSADFQQDNSITKSMPVLQRKYSTNREFDQAIPGINSWLATR